MEKRVKRVKKGEDDNNLKYWLTLSCKERLIRLETLRQEIIDQHYDT